MLVTLLSRACAVLLLTLAFAGPARAADEIETTATQFLESLDHEDYGGAWKALHPEYQKLGSEEQWRTNVARLRAELGAYRERKVGFREFTDKLPYLPPDRYLVVRFVSRFEKQESAQEIVVLKPGSGVKSGWSVAGYSVR